MTTVVRLEGYNKTGDLIIEQVTAVLEEPPDFNALVAQFMEFSKGLSVKDISLYIVFDADEKDAHALIHMGQGEGEPIITH